MQSIPYHLSVKFNSLLLYFSGKLRGRNLPPISASDLDLGNINIAWTYLLIIVYPFVKFGENCFSGF